MSALGSNSKGNITFIFAELGMTVSGIKPIEYSVVTPLVV